MKWKGEEFLSHFQIYFPHKKSHFICIHINFNNVSCLICFEFFDILEEDLKKNPRKCSNSIISFPSISTAFHSHF